MTREDELVTFFTTAVVGEELSFWETEALLRDFLLQIKRRFGAKQCPAQSLNGKQASTTPTSFNVWFSGGRNFQNFATATNVPGASIPAAIFATRHRNASPPRSGWTGGADRRRGVATLAGFSVAAPVHDLDPEKRRESCLLQTMRRQSNECL